MNEFCMSKSFHPERIRGDFNYILVKVNDKPSYIAWFLRIDTKERLQSYIDAFGVYLGKEYFKAKEAIINKRHFSNQIQGHIDIYLRLATEKGVRRITAFDDIQLINNKFMKGFINAFFEGKIVIVNKNLGYRFLEDNIEIIKEEQREYLDFPIGEEVIDKCKVTARKGYDIEWPDKFSLSTGYIDPKGKWYSCFSQEHIPFAQDYLKKYYPHLKYAKETMLDKLGWIAVSEVSLGYFVQVGKKGINSKQRLTLKEWFKKYKVSFKVQGVKEDYGEVDSEYDDFFEV